MKLWGVLFLVLLALTVRPVLAATRGPGAKAFPLLIIAHRGASGERPEHTLASYDRAIDEGADFIEPDLVITRDGALVVRHENEISGTTDVADHPEFADRKTTKTIDGQTLTGWFTEDFTLAELRTLRAKERLPQLRPANRHFDGLYQIPTLDEVIRLAKARSAETGRVIGIYPETKHPAYFRSIGLPLEERLVHMLAAQGWTGPDAPVFIQSFDPDSLKRLHGLTRVRLIQLVDTDPAGQAMTTPAGLAAVARYANGLGPNAQLLFRDPMHAARPEPSDLVRDAHAAGLKVHPWTLRAENAFLPPALRHGDDPAAHGDFPALVRAVAATGVDGFFSDFPGYARASLAEPTPSAP